MIAFVRTLSLAAGLLALAACVTQGAVQCHLLDGNWECGVNASGPDGLPGDVNAM
jgi:hypothetical protein